MSAPDLSHRVAAGPFEIDLSLGQVFRDGGRVHIQYLPFRVLALLLERPGEVVTREELQAQVWPADTYVGFDEGLNTAIRKLRVVFGDSAENSRYIETVPRRGYRFIAPVRDRAPAVSQEIQRQAPLALSTRARADTRANNRFSSTRRCSIGEIALDGAGFIRAHHPDCCAGTAAPA